MATNRRDVLLRIRSEGIEETEAEVRTMRHELREFGNTEATARVDVRTAGVDAQIKKVQDRLERLSRQEATPAVRLATARAVEQLDRLEAKLERLKHERVEVDVDFRRGALERTTAGLGALDRGVQRVGKGFAESFRAIPFIGGFIAAVTNGVIGLGSALGKVTAQGVTTMLSSFQSLGSFAGPIANVAGSLVSLAVNVGSSVIALSLLAAAAQAVIGVFIALAGVIGALVASLAAAAGGLAALAVAFGAILGPAILAVVAFMTRFVAVLKARQAREQELAQSVQASKAAEQQRKAALDSSRQAHEQLAQATIDGNRAIKQSIEDVRDAQLGLERSRLGVREARLNLAQSRRELREFLAQAGAVGPKLNELVKQFSNVEFNPASARGILSEATGGKGGDPLELQRRILAVQSAQLGIKEAVDQTTHAERNLAQATKQRADYVRRGLDAYKPYRQALEQVRRADERVARAQDQATAAHRKYEQALRALTPQERGFLGTLDAFLKKFSELAKVVSAPIFAGLGRAMQSLQGFFSDSRVQSGLEAIGRAIGDFFAALGKQLGTDRWRTAFAQFASAAAGMISGAGRAFGRVLEILRIVAQTALPTLQSVAHRAGSAIAGVANQPGRIRSVVEGLIHSFRIWGSIAGHVAGIVLGFLRAAKGTGDGLAETIRRLVTRWDRWINSRAGQERVRRFLRDSVTHVRNLLSELPKVLEAFKNIAAVVNAIADATKTVADFLKFNSGKDTTTRTHDIAADRDIIQREVANLQKHLTVEDRASSRTRLAEALRDLQSNAKLPPQLQALLDRLKRLGFQSGGLVPGSGSGDRIPAMLEPGEFVLRRAVVRQLSLPVLRAVNGGAVPRVAAAPASAGGVTIEQHNHITSSDPDPRHYASKLGSELGNALSREIQKLGLVSP